MMTEIKKKNLRTLKRLSGSLMVLLWVGLVSGCACLKAPDHSHDKLLHHVVLVWLKEPQEQIINDIVTHTSDLAAIPQVKSVYVGRPVENPRPVVDTSYDVGIIVTFENFEALQQYLKHPVHTGFVSRYVKAHLEKLVVYDF